MGHHTKDRRANLEEFAVNLCCLAALTQIVAHHGGERQQHHHRAENLKSDHLQSPFWKYTRLIRAFGFSDGGDKGELLTIGKVRTSC